MRVLITGSREWRNVRLITETLRALPRDAVIVHGAATGADHIAHSIALDLGMEVEPHFPNYAKYDVRVAPLMRNHKMIKLGADLCLAFPTENSRGTWHCVKFARMAGIPVTIVSGD